MCHGGRCWDAAGRCLMISSSEVGGGIRTMLPERPGGGIAAPVRMLLQHPSCGVAMSVRHRRRVSSPSAATLDGFARCLRWCCFSAPLPRRGSLLPWRHTRVQDRAAVMLETCWFRVQDRAAVMLKTCWFSLLLQLLCVYICDGS